MDPLEQMLIEHPSMSVYQMRCSMNEEEEEEEGPGTDEDISRSSDVLFKEYCTVRNFKRGPFYS